MPANPTKSNLFADKENGLVKRIDRVDTSFAYVTVLKELPSKYSMPLSEYDTTFMARHAIIDAGDMRLPDGYRPPANWEQYAERQAVADLNEDRGETPQGVRIGDDEPPYGAVGI